MALMTLPCLPMTLPLSDSSTLSLRTDTLPSMLSSTVTASGLSTSLLTTKSASSFIARLLRRGLRGLQGGLHERRDGRGRERPDLDPMLVAVGLEDDLLARDFLTRVVAAQDLDGLARRRARLLD